MLVSEPCQAGSVAHCRGNCYYILIIKGITCKSFAEFFIKRSAYGIGINADLGIKRRNGVVFFRLRLCKLISLTLLSLNVNNGNTVIQLSFLKYLDQLLYVMTVNGTHIIKTVILENIGFPDHILYEILCSLTDSGNSSNGISSISSSVRVLQTFAAEK